MKYLFLASLLCLIACDGKDKKILQIESPIQAPVVQPVKEENIAVEKTSGELCDLYDDEERETHRVFLVSKDNKVTFFRVNNAEEIAYPSIRTAHLDLYYMFKASHSDRSMMVSLIERTHFKDKEEWRDYSEVINAIEGQSGDKYVLARTRFLRDKDKHTERDWEQSYPAPFRISFCRAAMLEIRMEWLPRLRGW